MPRFIALFEDKDDLKATRTTFSYDSTKVLDFKREIDIVTGTMDSGEIWREMKSYKAKSKTNLVLSSSISPWAWGKRAKRANDESNDQGTKGSTPHRQYILDRVANETFARMDKNEREAKGELADKFNVEVEDIYWHFHDFKTQNTQSPQVANIVKSFDKEATGAPSFYKDHVTAHRASTFVMGTVDLFLTNSQSALADAVKEELKQKAGEVLDGE